MMGDAPNDGDLRALRWLRGLVMTLTVVMIVGFIVLIATLVTRMTGTPGALPLPEDLVLPGGADPVAVTAAAGWYAVVTNDDRILVYDRATRELLQTVTVDLPD